MTRVSDLTTILPRFGRSVRLDGTAIDEALDGYVLTARGQDVLARLVHGMTDPAGSRAFSIIGPYGSGKSSFATLLDALLGDDENASRLVLDTAPDLAAAFDAAQASFGGKWIRAVVTAPQREPITTTVLRALHRGAVRDKATAALRRRTVELLDQAKDPEQPSPTWDEIEPLVLDLARKRALLLIVDEFGKNLEAYARSDHEADLYLLQQLAETAAERPGSTSLIVVTVQHMSFEAYAEGSTVQQRREWAKVQGRFEDVPFIDSAATARDLIATAIQHDPDPVYAWLRAEQAQEDATAAARLGLPVTDPELLAQCYPLHPTILAVLPDLCSRFGQNERTLFSFLASGERLSITSRNADLDVDGLPTHRLDAVYDYFVEAASTLAGASSDATRWVEVSTTVRDATGLSDTQLRVVKTIGVLNLVAAYGSVRASRAMVQHALTGSGPELADPATVDACVRSLEDMGLLVHRDFADEYRLWRGSDFDLPAALNHARAVARSNPLAATLTAVHPLDPVVAGRHSHERATIRSFRRIWADNSIPPAGWGRPTPHDGTIVLTTAPDTDLRTIDRPDTPFPVLVVKPPDTDGLRTAAAEVAALLAVADDDRIDPADTAVRREITERLDHARQVLTREVERTYADAAWRWTNPPAGTARDLGPVATSGPLSAVLDEAYALAPRVAYEPLNRHELTSQGSRIRSELFRAMLDPHAWSHLTADEMFGFPNDSAEGSAFHAILVTSGIIVPTHHHAPGRGSAFAWGDPARSTATPGTEPHRWQQAWHAITGTLATADGTKVSRVLDTLAEPPHGLRPGVALLLVAANLVQEPGRTALFEHDTFVYELDDGTLDRMGRNPGNFTLAALNAQPGSTNDKKLSAVARALDSDGRLASHAATLGLDEIGRRTVVGLSRWISYIVNRTQNTYLRTTRTFGLPDGDPTAALAAAVRDTVLAATRPDRLLYRDLPVATGFAARLDRHGRRNDGMSIAEATEFGQRLAAVLVTIDSAYDRLVSHVANTAIRAAGVARLTELLPQAEAVTDVDTAAPAVKTLATRLTALDREVLSKPKPEVALRDWFNTVASRLTGEPIGNWRDTDIGPRTDRVADAFAELVRVAALRELNNRSDGRAAFALALTGAGGGRHQSIVQLPGSIATVADKALQASLDQLAEWVGVSADEALGLLLAAAAGRLMSQGTGMQEARVDDGTEGDRSGTDG